MERIGAVDRFVASIGLVAASLWIYRAWADPGRSVPSQVFGELAVSAMVVFVSMALAIFPAGRSRRFFGRYAIVTTVLTLACWVAPHPVRETILDRVLGPIDRWFSPQSSSGMTELERSLLPTKLAYPRRFDFSTTRRPFFSLESQVWLGLAEIAVALPIALLGEITRVRRDRRPRSPMRPELP